MHKSKNNFILSQLNFVQSDQFNIWKTQIAIEIHVCNFQYLDTGTKMGHVFIVNNYKFRFAIIVLREAVVQFDSLGQKK